MKNLTGKILACTLATILLGGCGFQLRGSKNIAANIEALTVTSGQQYGKLARALEAEMRAQHISDTGEHAWNLVILDQRIKQNVLAYNDSALATDRETKLMLNETYDEMAAALLRRIDFIAGQKQTPAP